MAGHMRFFVTAIAILSVAASTAFAGPQNMTVRVTVKRAPKPAPLVETRTVVAASVPTPPLTQTSPQKNQPTPVTRLVTINY